MWSSYGVPHDQKLPEGKARTWVLGLGKFEGEVLKRSVARWMGDAGGYFDVREWESHCWKEPMDNEWMLGYDAEQPFPVWKPDIDVIGVPPRSPRTRKQRGWYQIVGPAASARRASLPPTTSTNHATGWDLPPELLAAVIEFGIGALEDMQIFSRSDLQALSLVCRSFAAVCVPANCLDPVEGSFGISSRARFLEFRDTLSCQFHPLRDNIRDLPIDCKLASGPFLHLLPASNLTSSLPRLDQCPPEPISVSGPLPSAFRAPARFRSIHGLLLTHS